MPLGRVTRRTFSLATYRFHATLLSLCLHMPLPKTIVDLARQLAHTTGSIVGARLRTTAFFALAACTVPLEAQSAPVLVSADWLAEHLTDPHLVVIHAARQRSDYDAGHVPGAKWLAWESYTVTDANGLTVQLPPATQVALALEEIGINDDTRIVIAGGPIQVSARLYFTLDYFGLGARTSLLDGGIAAWRSAKRPTEVAATSASVARGNVTLQPRPALLADAAWVLANGTTPGVSLLDARLPQFYSGASAGGQPRAGHIPGDRKSVV